VEQEFYWRGVNDGTVVTDSATFHDQAGKDVYYGILLRTAERGTSSDCVPTTHVLWSDVDAKHFDGGKAAALFSLGRANLTPSILVDSGNGFHAYWLLKERVPFVEASGVMRGLAKAIGGDSVHDASRVLRLPGTHNHKTDPPNPVRLLYFEPTRRYRFSDFDSYAAYGWEPQHPRYEGVEGWDLSDTLAHKFGEGERNQGLTRLAGAMVAKGLGNEELLVALQAENMIRCVPPLPDHEVQAIVRSVMRYR
jgi:hypothetical protein